MIVVELKSPPKKYHHNKNKHIVYSCQYHVVFCPKYRRPVLTGKIKERLEELILEKCKELNTEVLDMVIAPDHVHLLLDADPTIGINKIVTQIKGYTSNKLRNEFPELRRKLPTLWTRGRFISTVGTVTLDVIRQYIDSQKGV
ncbi:transposase IS200-family protein [Methanocaldococcus sp. FS406-22]|nr:transposase IS200-family protein [Methanocaldococcus sp. FS406-22]